MLGALVLSRSVAQAAPALSNEILENVYRHVLASLNERLSQAPTAKETLGRPRPVRVLLNMVIIEHELIAG